MNRVTLEKVDRVIAVADLGRLTLDETIQLIKDRLDINVKKDVVKKRRYYMKKKTDKLWDIWRKDSYAYKRLHSECLAVADDSLRRINKQIDELDNGDRKNFFFLYKCFSERREWNHQKEYLISKIPTVDSLVRTESQENGMEQYQGEQSTNREMADSQRVF